MTLQSELEARKRFEMGYYLDFAGIETHIGTHDFAATHGFSGAFIEAIPEGTLTGSAWRLNREKGFVEPGGFSCQVAGKAAVLDLLRRRGGVEVPLRFSRSAVTTDIYIDDGTLGGQTVYVDRETIVLGTWNGSSHYTGCTRGAHGSIARPHLKGATLSTAPRHWQNRKVTLREVHLRTGTDEAVGTFLLSASPRWSNGFYQLSGVGLGSTLKRSICTGWNDVTAIAVEDGDGLTPAGTVEGDGLIRATIPDLRQFENSTLYGAIRVDAGERWGIYFLRGSGAIEAGATSADPDYVWFGTSQRWAGDLTKGDILAADSVTLRQCEVVSMRPGQLALAIMLSDLGDGTNHSFYDVLPGRSVDFSIETEDMSRKRMGAGLPAAWVDVDSWEDVPGEIVGMVLDEEMELIDFLTNDILPWMGGFVYVTPEGKIAFQRYAPETVRGNAYAIGAAVTADDTIESADDEMSVVSRVGIECNYHPRDGFLKRVEVVFEDTSEMLGEQDREINLKSRTTWVGTDAHDLRMASTSVDVSTLKARLERYRVRQDLGSRRHTRRFPWSLSKRLRLATRVNITDPDMPNHEGSLGVTSEPHEIVSYDPEYSTGDVICELENTTSGVRWAPSALVSSWDGGTNTITFQTTGTHGDGRLFEDKPGRLFMLGATVELYDFSAATPYDAAPATAVITAVSDDSITLSSAPSPTPANGDLCMLQNSDDTGNPTDDGVDVWDNAFAATTGLQVGSGSYLRDGPRWA